MQWRATMTDILLSHVGVVSQLTKSSCVPTAIQILAVAHQNITYEAHEVHNTHKRCIRILHVTCHVM
jgi:hypothetical protein